MRVGPSLGLLLGPLLGIIWLAASAAALAAPEPSQSEAPPDSLDRGRINHEAILRGEKTLFDLAPAEQDAVRAFDKRVRAEQPFGDDDLTERCIDKAYATRGRAPTAADEKAIEIQCR